MLKGGVTNISAPQKVQHILSLTFHFSARVRRFSSFSHCLLFYLNGHLLPLHTPGRARSFQLWSTQAVELSNTAFSAYHTAYKAMTTEWEVTEEQAIMYKATSTTKPLQYSPVTVDFFFLWVSSDHRSLANDDDTIITSCQECF